MCQAGSWECRGERGTDVVPVGETPAQEPGRGPPLRRSTEQGEGVSSGRVARDGRTEDGTFALGSEGSGHTVWTSGGNVQAEEVASAKALGWQGVWDL